MDTDFSHPTYGRMKIEIPCVGENRKKGAEPPAGVTIYRASLRMKVDIFNTDKKYQIIYADPPWTYRGWSGKGKTAANHYSCMKKEEIFELPVSEIADDNCILFLWVTSMRGANPRRHNL